MQLDPFRYRFGPFAFDPSQQELRNGDERTTLPATLNRLLLLLLERPGQLVSRDEIGRALWEAHGLVDVENGINGAVRRLRAQLSAGSAKAGPPGLYPELYIETVVGTGYRFVAPVAKVCEEPVVPAREPTLPVAMQAAGVEAGSAPLPGMTATAAPVDAMPARRSVPRYGIAFAALTVLVMAALAFAGIKRYSRQTTEAVTPALKIDWTPVTYEELEDQLTAQAISPSGTWVATSDRAGIAVQSLHAQDARPLETPEGLRVDHLAWFADERHLLATGVRGGRIGSGRETPEAWIVSLGVEPPKLLLHDAAMAAVSPDGKRIAYAREGGSEVWIADADGQGTHRLLSAKAGERFTCLLWSPGSDRVVVDRSTPTRVDTDVEKAAVDQLQHLIRWTYESYDATNGKLLASQADLRFDTGALLADGRFFYPTAGEGGAFRLEAVRTDFASGAIVGHLGAVAPADFGIGTVHLANLTASRGGKELSAILERPASDVYVGDLRYPAEGGMPVLSNIERLARHTGTTYPTAWSPSGEELIFDEGDAGRWVIASARPHGGKPTLLADTGGRAVQGQFTPDGKWLLFLHYAGKPPHVESIDRVPPGGGRPETIYRSANILDYRCSRASGGGCVVRETMGNKELVFHALDAEKGRGAELARTPWVPNVLGDWSLSPDGTTVAMANHDSGSPGFALIWVGAGGAAKRMQVDGFGTVLCPTWAVDGQGWFVETHSAAGYALVYVDQQGRAGLFLKSPDPIWAVQSRDGKKLGFPGHTPLNRNVWTGALL